VNLILLLYNYEGTTMKLYIYDHCPYCVKARMIFGFKKHPIKLVCLLNDDEKTPISMIGSKMVPILELKSNHFMPESLDIISYIDQKDKNPLVSWESDKKLSKWLDKNSLLCYELAMPRWIQAPLDEFKTQGAKNYFKKKKENYIGSFETALKRTNLLIKDIKQELEDLSNLFTKKQKFFSHSLTEDDFHLFAFLRSLSIVKGLVFPEKLKYYSQHMSQQSQIPLHHSIAIR